MAVRQRPDHYIAAIVGTQLGRHGLERAIEEHVEKESFDDIVAMMPQGHLGRANLVGEVVQGAATQARAQRAGGLALRDQLLDNRIGVLLDDMVFNPELLEIGRQHMLGKARLFLVHVHGNNAELDRRDLLQVQQHVEHRVAVLAA
jgi:hypothetical protein